MKAWNSQGSRLPSLKLNNETELCLVVLLKAGFCLLCNETPSLTQGSGCEYTTLQAILNAYINSRRGHAVHTSQYHALSLLGGKVNGMYDLILI